MKKKIFSMLLAMVLILSLTACGNDSSVGENSTVNGDTETKYNESTEKVFSDYNILGTKTDVELGDYKGFTLEVSKTTVTEEDIQEELEYLINNDTYYKKILEGSVEDGDTVNVSFIGYVDGAAFDGGSAEYVEVTIGEGKFIEGFEDSLIGGTVGQKITATTKFPNDYGVENLNGKDAVFEITINFICGEKVKPEMTDAFVKEYTEYESLNEYKEYVKKSLEEFYEEDFEENKDNYYWSAVEEALLKTSKINTLNKTQVYEYYEGLLDYYTSYASSFGYAMETFCQTFFEMSQNDFCKELASMSIDYVSFVTLIDEIAKKESITVTDEEYNAYLDEIVKEYEYESKDVLLKEIEEANDEENIRKEILREKVVDFILKSSTIKEK